jgi:hypothetical protein
MSLLLLLHRKALGQWLDSRCKLFRAHSWDAFSYGKRRCVHCGEEQWLMKKQFPKIGEAGLTWVSMRLPERFL